MMKKILTTLLLITSFVSSAALAAAPALQGKYGDWEVFTIGESGGRVCYMSSRPVSKTGNYKRRGEPYFLVTYRSPKVSEISASSGYPYKKGSFVKVKVDSRLNKDLFTSAQTPKVAWAKSHDDDKAIVHAMKKGMKMTVRGTSQLGTYSEDSYSLKGFTKAYGQMASSCK